MPLVDLSGTGQLDLLVAGGDTLAVFRGDGAGAFQRGLEVNLGLTISGLTCVDLGGELDRSLVLTLGGSRQTGAIGILRLSVDGSFLPARIFPAESAPCSPVAVDLDNDNIHELVVSLPHRLSVHSARHWSTC